jgi:hypothetical protein
MSGPESYSSFIAVQLGGEKFFCELCGQLETFEFKEPWRQEHIIHPYTVLVTALMSKR